MNILPHLKNVPKNKNLIKSTIIFDIELYNKILYLTIEDIFNNKKY